MSQVVLLVGSDNFDLCRMLSTLKHLHIYGIGLFFIARYTCWVIEKENAKKKKAVARYILKRN